MKQYGVCFKSHELLLICVPYLSVADVKFHHNLDITLFIAYWIILLHVWDAETSL